MSKVHNSDNTQADSQGAWDAGKPSPSGQGSSVAVWFVEATRRFCLYMLNGMDRLHRPAYSVTFNVKNVGSLYGTEVLLFIRRESAF